MSNAYESPSNSPVDSVFARIGSVIAAVSDYDASQVDNDSGVSGATVKDALDALSAAAAGSAIVGWGNKDVDKGTITRYLAPWWTDKKATTTEVTKIPMPTSGTVSRMYVRHNDNKGNGGDVVYTLRKNGSDTALTVTLASGAVGVASDLSNSVVVAVGDHLSVSATKASDISNGMVYAVVSCKWVAS